MKENGYREQKYSMMYGEYETGCLPEDYRRLREVVREAAHGAYREYSGFAVGAVVVLENGEIVRGANQENVAYPSGMCAERVALFYAGATYPGVAVKTLAIIARNGEEWVKDPVTPCGACRQVMYEFQGEEEISVITVNKSNLNIRKLSDFLPFGFKI